MYIQYEIKISCIKMSEIIVAVPDNNDNINDLIKMFSLLKLED